MAEVSFISQSVVGAQPQRPARLYEFPSQAAESLPDTAEKPSLRRSWFALSERIKDADARLRAIGRLAALDVEGAYDRLQKPNPLQIAAEAVSAGKVEPKNPQPELNQEDFDYRAYKPSPYRGTPRGQTANWREYLAKLGRNDYEGYHARRKLRNRTLGGLAIFSAGVAAGLAPIAIEYRFFL